MVQWNALTGRRRQAPARATYVERTGNHPFPKTLQSMGADLLIGIKKQPVRLAPTPRPLGKVIGAITNPQAIGPNQSTVGGVIDLGERDKEDAMNMRVRQLWAPVLSTVLISVAVQSVAMRVPQLPPWVFFTRNGVSIVLAPLWMLALPFIGALGAWLSLRAGGQYPRPPADGAGLSLVERRHPDAGGSAVDDHRTPLLAEHQAGAPQLAVGWSAGSGAGSLPRSVWTTT